MAGKFLPEKLLADGRLVTHTVGRPGPAGPADGELERDRADGGHHRDLPGGTAWAGRLCGGHPPVHAVFVDGSQLSSVRTTLTAMIVKANLTA